MNVLFTVFFANKKGRLLSAPTGSIVESYLTIILHTGLIILIYVLYHI
jgi:hypothetical protein